MVHQAEVWHLKLVKIESFFQTQKGDPRLKTDRYVDIQCSSVKIDRKALRIVSDVTCQDAVPWLFTTNAITIQKDHGVVKQEPATTLVATLVAAPMAAKM